MRETKKKILKAVFVIGLPIIILVNIALLYFVPEDLATDQEKVLWFANRSAPTSMILGMLIYAGIFRYWMSKYK